MRSPVEERGSSCKNTSRSWKLGTTFSIPTTEIRVLGRVRHIRPLPSDSTTTMVPVSATAKFAPETATASDMRSEEHTSELQSRGHLVCRLLLEKKKKQPQ